MHTTLSVRASPPARVATLLAALVAGLSACHRDDPVTGADLAPPDSVVASAPYLDLVTTPRFDVQVKALGSIEPNSAIQIVATVTALVASDRVQIRITVPELEAARLSSWGTGFRVPVRVGIAPITEQETRLAPRQSTQAVATLTIPQPGYYRVVVTAEALGEIYRYVDGRTLVTGAVREMWLWVAPGTGRLMDEFNPRMFPAGVVPEPGPFRTTLARTAEPSAPGVPAAPPAPDAHLWQAVYWNVDAEPDQYEPIVGSQWNAYWYNSGGQQVTSRSGVTDAEGEFTVPCPMPNTTHYNFMIELRDTHVDVIDGTSWNNNNASQTSCGNTNPMVTIVSSMHGRVFTNLTGPANAAPARFGRARGLISVFLDPNPTDSNSFYQAGFFERIVIRSTPNLDHVWGPFGIFTSAHEYGHAYQYVAIDEWGDNNCTNNKHFFTETENLSCAFVEGFADFFAMWLAGDRLTTQPFSGDNGLENNFDELGRPTNPPPPGLPQADGMRVEAAVAAFLYDMVDGDNEPDSPSNTAGPPESFDPLTVPGTWIADMIHYCRLNASIVHLDGPDQLVYCFEQDPGAVWVGRTFSPAWRGYSTVTFEQPLTMYDRWQIRRLWKCNFYGANCTAPEPPPPVPPPPPPVPPPPPPCETPPCMDQSAPVRPGSQPAKPGVQGRRTTQRLRS